MASLRTVSNDSGILPCHCFDLRFSSTPSIGGIDSLISIEIAIQGIGCLRLGSYPCHLVPGSLVFMPPFLLALLALDAL